MNKNISNLIANGLKNVLHQAYEKVPIPEVGHSKRKFITKEEIQDLARENRIATDEDVSTIFSFLGQVRDRLLNHVSNMREREAPPIMGWILKACELNKDILISDKAQITLPDIQLKYADRVFRSYVKIIEDKAYCRLEESLILNQVLPEALDNIRYPYRSIEDKIIQLAEQLSQLDNSLNMFCRLLDKMEHLKAIPQMI